MESESDDPYKVCVGCLTMGRKLHVVTDKTSLQMYSCLLDFIDVENHNIPLCYECMGRLNGIVRFKKQVRKAHRFLKRFNVSQDKSMTRLSLTRTQKYEWRPQTIKLNQLKPNPKKQPVRPRNEPKSKVLDPECVIISDDDYPNIDRKQQEFDTLNNAKNHLIITPRNIHDKNPLNIEKSLTNVEKNPHNLDTIGGKSQLPFDVNNIKKDLLDTKNQTETTTEMEVDFSTANIKKREFDFDATNEKITQKDSTINEETKQNNCMNWEVNIKQEKATIEVKLERVEQSETELQNFKEEVEDYEIVEDNEVNEPTASEFSDSDDEPLHMKKIKKKEVKKEGKNQRRRRTGVVSDSKIQKHLQQLNIEAGHIERVILTWEEVEAERQKSLSSSLYTHSVHKCKDCTMGFNHVVTYETHMLKHAPEAGDFECDICKTRFKSENALVCHTRRHTSRWRCRHCDAVFSRASVAADHASRAHAAPNATFKCRLCSHTATSLSQFRIHMKSHSERQHCEQCGKSFRDKYLLKKHQFIHMNRKDYACKICDKSFICKRSLESHMYTHEPSQNLYCAECDLNYKNPNSFYQHFKYSLKHVSPEDMKYACEFCSHKFARPRRLEEHRLSVHLKIAPHKCDEEGCTFASASRASLRTHYRMVHRNQRFVKNHVCHTCGKAYSTKRALDHHINSHTGVRPFPCSVCSATFAQSSAVYNHTKLMHKAHFERMRKERQKNILKNIVSNKTEAKRNPETISDPVETVSDPVEIVSNPVEIVSNPVEAVFDPVEIVSNPVEIVSNPVEAVFDPVEDVSEPVKNVSVP